MVKHQVLIFINAFWNDIKQIVFDSLKEGYVNKILSAEQRRSVLQLLPQKGKDLTHLKNWRPISLLNTDYKILTSALSERLQKVLPNIIASDQNGYLRGRFIGLNIRTLMDVIDIGNNMENVFLAFLDYEKAFDSIDRNFLTKCLKAFSFPEYMINWIKFIYTKTECTIINNGFTSKYFQLERGVRQGCPLSALLFLCVVEVLANNMRENPNIKGIKINNSEVKITQLADDMTLILTNINSLQLCINIINLFYQASGLKLNSSKTEVFAIGRKSDFYTNKSPYRLKWVKDRVYGSIGIPES